MKFCSLVLELHLPQNFCHTHTDRQTDIFQTQSNRVQDIPKRVNPSKTGNRKFAKPILSSTYIEENKKKINIANKRSKRKLKEVKEEILISVSVFAKMKSIILNYLQKFQPLKQKKYDA